MNEAELSLQVLTVSNYAGWLKKQPVYIKNNLTSLNFDAKEGAVAKLFDKTGSFCGAVAVISESPNVWSLAHLVKELPAFKYKVICSFNDDTKTLLALGLELASYKFNRYKSAPNNTPAPTFIFDKTDSDKITSLKEAITLVRDMVNTPAEDMTPKQISETAKEIAKEYKATFSEITGDDLLKKGFPVIHMVGRASSNKPRLIELKWGKKNHPLVAIIGKGVCFDSGGLDIKGSANMLLMKKDMAGAAHALALAKIIMDAMLPVRLHVLCPSVENSVSGNAFRPLDIVKSRSGITIEIGNTDAEGRLVMCDALTEACSHNPDIVIDMATLTGAARTALGTDIPAFFTPNDKIAASLHKHAVDQFDPLWRLPLWSGYRDMLKSNTADINNAGDSPYAGSITAALFLKEFVNTTNWIHIDMMAWNLQDRAGRPKGGEAMGLRALLSFLSERYSR